ncbi:hypothetical protein NBRC111894_257 [Sporolactobacillus inulinus]|uniref:Uncharacterized protein n=2 Tax=Sporolactobacillus inulinus TaxID=2078 RepID=A0A4Y1Z6P3_9BACL|nr:hypothetical protein NBRC111894_257 [Sporolactobacillus inulinus]
MMSYPYEENNQSLFVPHEMNDRNVNQSTDNTQALNNLCRKYMNYYVIAQMADGTQMEGIVEEVTDQGVIMLVPEDAEPEADSRFFYGPRPRRRFRRFNRFLLPFFLFATPFLYPFPFYY